MNRRPVQLFSALTLLVLSALFDLSPHRHRGLPSESIASLDRAEKLEQLGGCSSIEGGARHLHAGETAAVDPCVACLRQTLTTTQSSAMAVSRLRPAGDLTAPRFLSRTRVASTTVAPRGPPLA
ncbi:MAG TPA: hypothetical protein VNM92_16915 [Thermoanaerobaculia bacterium]|nr:hypothetical protein [Thermoanaerobaculia bacterium]